MGNEARLAYFGDFFVEVGEGRFKGLAVIRVCRGFEVMDDSDSGKLQVFAFQLAAELFRAFAVVAVMPVRSFACFHLCFYVFAFPASRHTVSLTHFAAAACVYPRESWWAAQALAARLRRKTGRCVRIMAASALCASRARFSAKMP